MCYRTISPLRPITTIASTVNTALVCLNGPLPNSEGFTVCKEEEDEEAEVGHAVQLSKYCPDKKGHGRRARAGACGTTVVVGDGRWSGHPIIGHGCFNHSMNSGGGGGGVTHSRPRPKLCFATRASLKSKYKPKLSHTTVQIILPSHTVTHRNLFRAEPNL